VFGFLAAANSARLFCSVRGGFFSFPLMTPPDAGAAFSDGKSFLVLSDFFRIL